jgi:hypothetical protein
MSTLPIREPHIPQLSVPSVMRIAHAVTAVIDAYFEALHKTHDVQMKYTFAEW